MLKLRRDSWKIIETILIRYPMRKREYEEYISDIMAASDVSNRELDEDYRKPQSVTEAKALKMTSVYAERMKKEIEAVELVYNDLKKEEQKVIMYRYWTGTRKPVPYLQMKECSYSERQAKRIVLKVMSKLGKYLGEIK